MALKVQLQDIWLMRLLECEGGDTGRSWDYDIWHGIHSAFLVLGAVGLDVKYNGIEV